MLNSKNMIYLASKNETSYIFDASLLEAKLILYLLNIEHETMNFWKVFILLNFDSMRKHSQ